MLTATIGGKHWCLHEPRVTQGSGAGLLVGGVAPHSSPPQQPLPEGLVSQCVVQRRTGSWSRSLAPEPLAFVPPPKESPVPTFP